MKNYSNHVKTVLDDRISDMSQNSWLFVKRPGSDFTRDRKMNFSDTIKCILSMQKNSTVSTR